ncbi:MAG: hypothetical protein DWQ01_10090 [Planctomycetota bacterium]|nr:MAG: hypothetical protein DWQ01_10090 [Planctomycetota bacterium]
MTNQSIVRAVSLALSFALLAVTGKVSAQTCPLETRFDADLEGWVVENNGASGGASHVMTGGCPGGYMEIMDSKAGASYRTVAPSKFHGNLVYLDGGKISVCMWIVHQAGVLTSQAGRVQIEGGGLVATLDLAPTGLTVTPKEYSGTLSAAEWGVTQQVWSTILSDVTKIYVVMDASGGNETTGFDTFSLSPPLSNQTELISKSWAGGFSDSGSGRADVSANGRYVTFESDATNLVPDDQNGKRDIFVYDRYCRTTVRVSVDSNGIEADGGESRWPSISDDGRFVAFHSRAGNLAAGMAPGILHAYVHDRDFDENGLFDETAVGKRETRVVSKPLSGRATDGWGGDPDISGSGRYVSFSSNRTDLVAGTFWTGNQQIYVYDRVLESWRKASMDGAGTEGDAHSFLSSISWDGEFVTFSFAA